jgi:hypothetical protein
MTLGAGWAEAIDSHDSTAMDIKALRRFCKIKAPKSGRLIRKAINRSFLYFQRIVEQKCAVDSLSAKFSKA